MKKKKSLTELALVANQVTTHLDKIAGGTVDTTTTASTFVKGHEQAKKRDYPNDK